MSVDPAGRLSEGQPFRPSVAAALAAAAAGEDRASALLRQVARYVRAIRAASYPAGPGASGPEAAAEARELGDLLGYKVVSGALTDRTAAGLLAWERSAALADRVLPGWTVRVHYDSTRDGGPCRLRAMHNVELVDMAASALPVELWPYAPALEGDAVAAVFVGGGARPPGACGLERVAEWQDCGGAALAPRGDGADGAECGAGAADWPGGCAEGRGCVWGVRWGGLGAVRRAVRCAAEDGGGPAAARLRRGLVGGGDAAADRAGSEDSDCGAS